MKTRLAVHLDGRGVFFIRPAPPMALDPIKRRGGDAPALWMAGSLPGRAGPGAAEIARSETFV
jgi:hypothetical protein